MADYLFVIWVRCINGDKQNVMHTGWQAKYPRERKLLERIINIVNAWKLATRRDDIPSLKDFRNFVIREAKDNEMSDAIHIDQRCLRGNPASIDRRGRSPRDRTLLIRILDMLRAFQIAREGQPSDLYPRP